MSSVDTLYQLLPAVYRERDDAQGQQLRALLRIIGAQAEIVHADIARLWDNLFIETCDRWAIPYIGDLVGNDLLHDAQRLASDTVARALFTDLTGPHLRPSVAVRTRADVAKTIGYRRRKGTLPMLEELARDVTGWPAHAVEFFERLGWTQCIRNHVRIESLRTPDIRRIEPMDRIDGPFDIASHTVDVRPIGVLNGWYNIANLGFFLWRLASYPLTNVRARQSASAPWRFHVSPLGNPAPLFSRWRREGDEAGLATELHVAGPIRRAFFHEDLERYRTRGPARGNATDLYGAFAEAPDASVFITRNGQAVTPAVNPNADIATLQVVCRRLDPWPAAPPKGAVIAIDVERGRLAVGDGWPDPTTSVDVSYHYGFSADLGGGAYDRGRWLVRPALATLRLAVQQSGAMPGSFTTLGAALAVWATQNRPNTIITIVDNRTYAEPLTIALADNRWLVIEAVNGARPHIVPEGGVLQITGSHAKSELTLGGLLIEGAVHVGGELQRLRLLHTTLVPGRGRDEDNNPATTEPSLVVEGAAGATTINAKLRVEIAFSIVGPLRIPTHADGLWALDSIVDGIGGPAIAGTDGVSAAPPTTLERVTVFGPSRMKKLLLASETIFTEPVAATQRQQGCARFSYVPPESASPRRYRCQPDLAIAAQTDAAEKAAVPRWLVPSFTSARYGDPAYGQLHLACPVQITTGAEDGSEMGVFCHLKQPQRAANLRRRLDEYLPFGLEAGLIYVT